MGLSSTTTRRPTIGLLVAQLEPVYQGAIWRQVANSATRADVNLVVFSGGSLTPTSGDSDIPQTSQNEKLKPATEGSFIYDIPSTENCDGLLILTPTVGSFSTVEELTRFCHGFAPIPVVSIGMAIPGVNSVVCDSRSGIREAIHHQVEVHGHNKIAFIRGPENHPEAIERFASYRETLQECGLAYDADLSAPGDFITVDQSRTIIQRWLRQGVQTIVTANDTTALDLIRYLQTLGLRIPSDIAVIGFDDRPDASKVLPALTTIRQPLPEMADEATNQLLAMIREESGAIAELITFPTHFVQRQSCGCASTYRFGLDAQTPLRDDPVSFLIQQLPGDKAFAYNWAEQFMLSFNAAMQNPSSALDSYKKHIDSLMYDLVSRNVDFKAWLSALVSLRQRMRMQYSDDRETWLHTEMLWDTVCASLNYLGTRMHSWNRFNFAHDRDLRNVVTEEILATYDAKHLERVLCQYFTLLDIPNAYIVTFDEQTIENRSYHSAQVAARSKRSVIMDSEFLFDPADMLLPTGMLSEVDAWQLVVEPLYSQTTHLGYAVFEVGETEVSANLYTNLRAQLSSAVMNIQLVSQLTHAYIEVEEQVVARTEELIEEMNRRTQVERARSAIYEISEAARNSQDLAELYPQIHQIVARLLPADNFYIAQVDEEAGMIEFPYFVDEHDPQPEPRPLDSPTITSLVIQRQEPLLIDPETFDELVDRGVSALIGSPSLDWLGVPLNLQGKTFGALVVQTYKPSMRYTQDDLQLLTFVSNQIALAIHRVRTDKERSELVLALQNRTSQLETAAEITKLTSALRDVQQVLEDAVILIQERFGYYFVGMYLIEGEPERAVLRAASGDAGQLMLASQHALPVGGESMIGWCTTNGQARLASDVSKESTRFANPRLPETRSELALPLLAGKVCIGAVSLQSSNYDAFSADDIRLLQAMTDHIAIAIENAALHERIRNYTAELEGKVAERTAALRASNEELSTFAYSVSHDLRAPLRRIDGFSEAVMQDFAEDLPDMAKEYLKRVRMSAEQMNDLIKALLELSRVTRSEIYRTQVDLSAMVQSLFAEQQLRGSRRNLSLVIPDGIKVNADPRLLRIAMNNLISNARKFSEKREHARIEVGRVVDDKETFYIKDNGAGFNPAYADRLFAPFQRLHDDAEFEGTGIGLATVQRIIRRHGGRIWAESQLGEGATFYFTLG